MVKIVKLSSVNSLRFSFAETYSRLPASLARSLGPVASFRNIFHRGGSSGSSEVIPSTVCGEIYTCDQHPVRQMRLLSRHKGLLRLREANDLFKVIHLTNTYEHILSGHCDRHQG